MNNYLNEKLHCKGLESQAVCSLHSNYFRRLCGCVGG